MTNPYASIAEMRKALDSRSISSVELTEMYLKRLVDVGSQYRVARELTRDRALSQARESDEWRWKYGEPKSMLDGIPFGAKDLYATKGIATRWGSPGHADQIFDYDATSIARLQAGGAVLIAKLAMIELAGGGNYNIAGASDVGATLCAWNKELWSGGSSSGSGAAAALGCCGFTLGSETSGSITCPSAFNGATGFRPTYGRVSRYGAMALCWTLDKLGPICRSAEDCAEVLKVMSGHDPLDPSSLRQPLSLKVRGRKPRIGLLKEDFKKNKADACEKAYHDAIAVLRKQGYETTEVGYPEMPYDLAVGIIVDAEGASSFENYIRGPKFPMLADINQVAGFSAALETRAIDYLWAMRMRTEALKANAVWEKCDCIFTPTFLHHSISASIPFDKTWTMMGGDSGPSNLLGWPCLAFPIGFETTPYPGEKTPEGAQPLSPGRAPLGGQVLAPCGREDICYRVARDFQKVTDWHLKRPLV